MRIAVINLVTGNHDILMLSPDAEQAFDEMDVRDFFETLGYDFESISWGEIKGTIREELVDVSSFGSPYIKE